MRDDRRAVFEAIARSVRNPWILAVAVGALGAAPWLLLDTSEPLETLLAWAVVILVAALSGTLAFLVGVRGWKVLLVTLVGVAALFLSLPALFIPLVIFGSVVGLLACLLHDLTGIGAESWCDP